MSETVLVVEKIRNGGLVFFPTPAFHLAGDLYSRAQIVCSKATEALNSFEKLDVLPESSASEWSMAIGLNQYGAVELVSLRCPKPEGVACKKVCRNVKKCLGDYFRA